MSEEKPVLRFGTAEDGDDTELVEFLLSKGLPLEPRVYRITRTIQIPASRTNAAR